MQTQSRQGVMEDLYDELFSHRVSEEEKVSPWSRVIREGLVQGEALELVHLPEFEWVERQEQHSRWGKAFIPSVCVKLWGKHQETRSSFGLQTQEAYRLVENKST